MQLVVHLESWDTTFVFWVRVIYPSSKMTTIWLQTRLVNVNIKLVFISWCQMMPQVDYTAIHCISQLVFNRSRRITQSNIQNNFYANIHSVSDKPDTKKCQQFKVRYNGHMRRNDNETGSFVCWYMCLIPIFTHGFPYLKCNASTKYKIKWMIIELNICFWREAL